MALIQLKPFKHGQFSIVDDSDVERLSDYVWELCRSGKNGCKLYAITRNRNSGITTRIRMHRFLMGVFDGEVDHINGNGLDNRRANLRLSTRSQNSANVGLRKTGTSSGFKGVYHVYDKNPTPNQWRAIITENGRYHHLGRFSDKTEAAKAYDRRAIKVFGEFAKTNQMLGLIP